jgi:hypothetical protein
MLYDIASPSGRSHFNLFSEYCYPLISFEVRPRSRCYSRAVPYISERNSGGLSDHAYDEDTLELEPISEQTLSTLRAAEEDHVAAIASEPQSSAPSPALAPTANSAQTRRAWPVQSHLLMSVAGILALSVPVANWTTNHHAADVGSAVPAASPVVPVSNLPASTAAETTPPAIAATEAITPPGPAVKLRNPFDASEVFEFPPGTTQVEARHAVRETLLQRARARSSTNGAQ